MAASDFMAQRMQPTEQDLGVCISILALIGSEMMSTSAMLSSAVMMAALSMVPATAAEDHAGHLKQCAKVWRGLPASLRRVLCSLPGFARRWEKGA